MTTSSNCARLVSACLRLEVVEVERLLLSLDRLPRQVVPHALSQLVEPGLVGGEEHEHVAVKASSRCSLVEELLGGNPSRAVGRLAGVRVLRTENDQADFGFVRHLGGCPRGGMDMWRSHRAGRPGWRSASRRRISSSTSSIVEVRGGPVVGEPGD